MADDLAAVRARIHSVQQLDDVIGAMRGIAAAHAQQSRALLPGFRAYADVIAQAIASALRLVDDRQTGLPRHPRCARIVFCPEQGFVGGFAERILDEACKRGAADMFLIGSRGLSQATARNVSAIWQSAMATQVDGIAGLCIRIVDILYEHLLSRRITTVEVIYPAWQLGAGVSVICQSLLPLDTTRFRLPHVTMPPLATLPSDVLLVSLAEEYVYASLCDAAMQAFVAENEVRAETMVRARAKVQEILSGLHLSEHRVRQEAITAEVVELVGSGLLAP
jgi:F-type H+-transporting ATPase subunit gamma